MHLLNVHTYHLERFPDERSIPPYAILSHTWTDGKEVQFADMLSYSSGKRDEGLDWQKIDFTCQQAIADGFGYAWIDTCCIDKSSSAELSEAINSMFRWYRNASICYVYLADVGEQETGELKGDEKFMEASGATQGKQIRESRWFTRGWTLQELIAPRKVIFYDCEWRLLGDQNFLQPDISAATSIPHDVLDGTTPLQSIGIAVKMSWASRRRTTRIEDEAYCLLGIFDINMPLLYGEGPKAFMRLQEEILKVSTDHTIFAWNGPQRQLLAPSPASFENSWSIVPRERPVQGDVFEMTSRGFRISLPFLTGLDRASSAAAAALHCVDLRVSDFDVCLPVVSNGEELEPDGHDLQYLPHSARYRRYQDLDTPDLRRRHVVLSRYAPDEPRSSNAVVKFALFDMGENTTYELYPQHSWDQETDCTVVPLDGIRREARAIWVGPLPSDSFPRGSLQRLAPARGVVISWVWPLANSGIAINWRKCSYNHAASTAEHLLQRRTFRLEETLLPDQVLTYSWARGTFSFKPEPIETCKNGLMVVARVGEKSLRAVTIPGWTLMV